LLGGKRKGKGKEKKKKAKAKEVDIHSLLVRICIARHLLLSSVVIKLNLKKKLNFLCF
jgi:hypothetical protein